MYEKNLLQSIITIYTKNNSKITIDLYVTAKSIKLLEENNERIFTDIESGKDFFFCIAKTIKENIHLRVHFYQDVNDLLFRRI